MKFDTILCSTVHKILDSNGIPMLLGEPGIGKSSWLEALAKEMHTQCFTLACNQLGDKTDVTGARSVPIIDQAGNQTGKFEQIFFPHATISRAIRYSADNPSETPILFLDEINRTTSDVTSALLSIPTARMIGNEKLPTNLRIVIAGNDKGNVTTLDEASVSRFVLIHVTPDINTFLMLDPDLNPFVKNTLQAHPECIFGKKIISVLSKKDDDDDDNNANIIEDIFDETEEMNQIATPRTISSVSRFLNKHDKNDLISLLANVYMSPDGEQMNTLQEIIEGFTGKTMFTTYLLNEIATGVQTMAIGTKATNNVPKPAIYDTLKACADMTSLNSMVASLSNSDKSGCMVYSLYEKADNHDLIIALAPQIGNLEPDDIKTLMGLKTSDNLDPSNTAAFLNGKSTLAITLGIILNV